jgi:CPA2 family monovalent cation:H+ antiporter-2
VALQVLATMGLVTVGVIALGLPWQTALAMGMTLALSSTAIVLQTLNEKDLMRTGRALGLLGPADAGHRGDPALALLPLLAVAPGPLFGPDGRSIQRGDAGNTMRRMARHVAGRGVAGLGRHAGHAGRGGGGDPCRRLPVADPFPLHPPSRLREMYTAVALVIVVGIAFLMILVGLSPALGAFVAGVVLANSEFRHELEADIEPFKGLLLGLFFITVGAGINFGTSSATRC